MSRYVVDSYAWVEYLGGSAKGTRVEELLDGAEESWTPTPVLAEVTSKVVRSGKDPAIAWQALRAWSTILPLDAETARSAGGLHAAYRAKIRDFALTDAVVLAVSRKLTAKVLTGDPHFQGMKGVEFLR
ncbi:MAG: type II toxin-antitoxin system VapC family toxin [Methanobacteriota archaeon]|nr:MAG: type II toxin-antitoxin system VapC family toxin [Euryarchaeota archaeon]